MQLKPIYSIVLSCVLSLSCFSTIFAQSADGTENKNYSSEKTSRKAIKELSTEFIIEVSKEKIAENEQKLLLSEELLTRHYCL